MWSDSRTAQGAADGRTVPTEMVGDLAERVNAWEQGSGGCNSGIDGRTAFCAWPVISWQRRSLLAGDAGPAGGVRGRRQTGS